MCGIAGAYGWVDEGMLHEMLEWIDHRGPDEAGTFLDSDAGVMIGAQRLSIVDIDGGSQPMWNEDGSVGVVFNGEIYNHTDLRTSLEERGHRFVSRCDTEVLVHLWEECGKEMVDYLEGAFAFSLWDRNEESIFLARDRLGIKPLYVGKTDRGYVWGSELPVLLIGGVDRTIDPKAVFNHFSMHFTPNPQTLLRDVRKVEPGHAVLIGPDGICDRQYWSLFDVDAGSVSIGQSVAADRLRSLLERSVAQRLMGDVPIGAFLSGGLDSSAIVALASKMKADPIKTYSVTFDDDALDESEEARLVADHFGTDHCEVPIDLSSLDLFGDLLRHLGEPTGHLQMLPLFALSRRASEDVKVALAGEGADELFAGYHYYQSIPRRKRTVELAPELAHDVAGVIAPYAPVGGNHLEYFSGLKNESEMILQHVCGFSTFRPDPETFLRTGESAASSGLRTIIRETVDSVADPDLVQRISAFETKYTIPDYHLYKADHVSMAQSLELRVPFLSTEIVVFAHSLPAGQKVTNRSVKRVLKRAVEDLLPDAIVHREKHPMRPPVDAWFRDEHAAIDTWFAREKLERTPYVDANRALSLRDAHRRGGESVGRTLWLLLTYVAWYHTFVDDDHAIV